MTNDKWTVGRVKEELPEVTVLANGVRRYGKLTGRRLPFARVYYVTPVGGYEVPTVTEFAWITVANALNAGRALVV